MSQEDLRDLLRARPFQPFRLHLTDGSHYDVMHPELVIPFKQVALVAVGGQPELGLPERAVTVSLLHILREEPLETVSGPGQSSQN